MRVQITRAARCNVAINCGQFTSAQRHAVCKELRVSQSVGRTGVCWDNAMQESFWSTLKTEFYNRHTWPTRQQAMTAT
jgi:putative transposase